MWLSIFYRVICLMCKKKLLIVVLNCIRVMLIFKFGKRRFFFYGMFIIFIMIDMFNIGVKNFYVIVGGIF